MIYVHVPFCRSFCTYCDFYSEVAAKCRKAEDAENQERMFVRFAEALVSEVKLRAHEITSDTNTLYIGGGTPSVLPLSAFEHLLGALRETGHGGPYEEFTVEVNPEDIVEKGEAYVEGLLRLGVNRISMGVQSFDDGILKFMNRRHDSLTARKAYAVLENAGVGNISVDLIFGLPQLSDFRWKDTLREALEISGGSVPPNHISSYQLSVEEGSMLARMVERGLWSEASEELCSRQYDILCETLREAGYNHYEISNFARPGYEAVHNSAYWSHVPYVGLGPGAHSFLNSGGGPGPDGSVHGASRFIRQWNKPDLKAYLENPSSVVEYESLSEDQLVLERIMLGLRTSEGIPADFLHEHCDSIKLKRALSLGHLVPTDLSVCKIPPFRSRTSLKPPSRVQNPPISLTDSLQTTLPCAKSPIFAHGYRIPESKFFISDSIISELV